MTGALSSGERADAGLGDKNSNLMLLRIRKGGINTFTTTSEFMMF
jgi:hypothetical protein